MRENYSPSFLYLNFPNSNPALIRLYPTLDSIQEEVHENNIMLHQICNVINRYLANHHQENENDFGRNVLANLLSNIVELRTLNK